MTWGQMAAVLQLSDLRHHFRRPQRPLQGRLAASLAAAGLFGGKFWPLQGRCEAVTLAPLLMVLLLWNILSAIFKLCCFSSDSLQVAVSFVSFQTRTGMIQNYNLAFVY